MPSIVYFGKDGAVVAGVDPFPDGAVYPCKACWDNGILAERNACGKHAVFKVTLTEEEVHVGQPVFEGDKVTVPVEYIAHIYTESAT